MENQEPSYWAVIPAQIRYASGLPSGAKLLYAEISSLTDKRGYCFASNDYFADLYGASVRTVQRYLDALKNAGFICIQDGDGGTGRRKIYAGINPLADNHDKNVMVPDDRDKNVTVTMTELSPPNKVVNKKENKEPPISPKSKKGPMPAELIARVAEYAGEDAELQTRFLQFAENRKAIRKPIETNRTLTLLLSKLDRLSGGNRDKKLKLIDLATERNWLSFFPLRDDPPPRPAKGAAPTYEPEVSAWP